MKRLQTEEKADRKQHPISPNEDNQLCVNYTETLLFSHFTNKKSKLQTKNKSPYSTISKNLKSEKCRIQHVKITWCGAVKIFLEHFFKNDGRSE